MTGLCLAAGLLIAPLGETVTVSWTHSIEKTRWEEDWRREDDRLRLVEARIRTSGAGMEPPPGAVLKDGVWHYTPKLPLLPRVLLRHSPHVPTYTICAGPDCRPADAWLPGLPGDAVLELAPCH
ncbi:DUF1850 domain-containing protein [Sulfuricystis thermophila]|uniref:DUF1850 domain-containing protein n=1 Tax=Sulfuricystis thermophila TaxID=2496847 RepID=UPI00103572D5|nr:DUF1850 domain-containing protein [Sulfuricystis thermophila]